MNNRLFYRLLIIILGIVIVFSSVMLILSRRDKDVINVSVILRNSDDDKWLAMKTGMEQAVSDNNVRINIVSTDRFLDPSDEITLIEREISNGADAIIMEPVDNVKIKEYLQSNSGRVQFALVDSGIDPEGLYTTVRANDIEIGRSIADAVYADYGTDLSGKKVGIVAGLKDQQSTIERLEGFYNRLAELGIHYNQSFLLYSGKGDEEILKNNLTYTFTDVVVCLDSAETGMTAEKMVELGKTTAIYGQGYSEKNVYYLDAGNIKKLVAVNEFNMGYLALESVLKVGRHRLGNSKDINVDIFTVDKENLYDEDIQNLMFPLVQ